MDIVTFHWGLRNSPRRDTIESVVDSELTPMRGFCLNSHKPECWLQSLVGPRRYLAVLPSQTRPCLFGAD